jgi:hypothetical protein
MRTHLLATALAVIALVAGCSSARRIVYLPDGRAAYMTACDDAGWQKCYKKATNVCKRHSYVALEKQRNPKVLYFSCRTT